MVRLRSRREKHQNSERTTVAFCNESKESWIFVFFSLRFPLAVYFGFLLFCVSLYLSSSPPYSSHLYSSEGFFYAFLSFALLFFSAISLVLEFLVLLRVRLGCYVILFFFSYDSTFCTISLFTLEIFSFWSLGLHRPSPSSLSLCMFALLLLVVYSRPSINDESKHTQHASLLLTSLTPIISVDDEAAKRMRRHKNIKFILFTLAERERAEADAHANFSNGISTKTERQSRFK